MIKKEQILNIIPSENLIVVRMGNNPNNSLVPTSFQNEMCERINQLSCANATSIKDDVSLDAYLYPNPSTGMLSISLPLQAAPYEVTIFDQSGRSILQVKNQSEINMEDFPSGMYYIRLLQNQQVFTGKWDKL